MYLSGLNIFNCMCIYHNFLFILFLFNSLIHFELVFIYKSLFLFFAYEYLIFPAAKTFLSLLYQPSIHVEDQLIVLVCIYFWI